MDFYPGMDVNIYPGTAVMSWLASNTNFWYTGYYLAPSPNHPETSWMGNHADLVSLNWGFLPTYVGEQPGTNPRYSHNLNAGKGAADAADAVTLASSDGFPASTVIYLDIEGGDLPSAALKEYYKAWVGAVMTSQYYPGIYCSDLIAQNLRDEDSRPIFWVSHYPIGKCNPGDYTNPYPTTIDPGTSAYSDRGNLAISG